MNRVRGLLLAASLTLAPGCVATVCHEVLGVQPGGALAYSRTDLLFTVSPLLLRSAPALLLLPLTVPLGLADLPLAFVLDLVLLPLEAIQDSSHRWSGGSAPAEDAVAPVTTAQAPPPAPTPAPPPGASRARAIDVAARAAEHRAQLVARRDLLRRDVDRHPQLRLGAELGQVELELGDAAAAVAALDSHLARWPGPDDAQLTRALARERVARLDGARADFDAAARAPPPRAEDPRACVPHLGAALTRAALGDLEGARAPLAAALATPGALWVAEPAIWAEALGLAAAPGLERTRGHLAFVARGGPGGWAARVQRDLARFWLGQLTAEELLAPEPEHGGLEGLDAYEPLDRLRRRRRGPAHLVIGLAAEHRGDDAAARAAYAAAVEWWPPDAPGLGWVLRRLER